MVQSFKAVDEMLINNNRALLRCYGSISIICKLNFRCSFFQTFDLGESLEAVTEIHFEGKLNSLSKTGLHVCISFSLN